MPMSVNMVLHDHHALSPSTYFIARRLACLALELCDTQ